MLPPAVTGFGLADSVMLKSACVAEATAMLTVLELSVVLVSRVAEPPVSVSMMMVPAANPVLVFTTTENVPTAPAATLGLVQLIVPVAPTAGVVHVHPVGGVMDWNVVLVGTVSVKVAVVQALGPLLVIPCV